MTALTLPAPTPLHAEGSDHLHLSPDLVVHPLVLGVLGVVMIVVAAALVVRRHRGSRSGR